MLVKKNFWEFRNLKSESPKESSSCMILGGVPSIVTSAQIQGLRFTILARVVSD
jgi:hypothetical protein